MKGAKRLRALRAACWAALAALLLMVWSLVDPRPIPVILAMSVAQALGTASLAAFLLVVWGDLRRASKDIERAGDG